MLPLRSDCSLPLMGIENLSAEYRAWRDRTQLITPHGDRKPAALRLLACCWRPSHYPSWGSKTDVGAGVADRAAVNSLPLMGIENASTAYRWSPASSSLPLMGIENLRCSRAPMARLRLITPHGDRKRGAGRTGRTGRPRLITPHGDRKLRAVAPLPYGSKTVAWQDSLPLMGIENCRARTGLPRTIRHLDSLPLMGIENSLVMASSSTCSRSTHYPSWGSKTRRSDHPLRRSSDHRIDNSLPLMGIENTMRGPDQNGRRSASSLPLMGIENAGRGGYRGTHYPSWGSKTGPAPRPSVHSLPLMGIENPPSDAIRENDGSSTSLPLMGIENWRDTRHRALGIDGPTHYPSWGSKTRTTEAGLVRSAA